jgi:hypothetical protein
MNVIWSPFYFANGEIQSSCCGRFHIIEGSDHFTLIYYGIAVFRDKREDYLKKLANAILEDELREAANGRSDDNPQDVRRPTAEVDSV